jgi:signal transduction histidine kinase
MSGVVAAWAVAQVGLGLYFALAYLVGRREKEFFLFSLLCFCFAISSVGVSIDYGSATGSTTAFAEIVTHAGMILAGAINVHFAMEFAQVGGRRKIAMALYGLAALFEILLLSGTFFDHSVFSGSLEPGIVRPPPTVVAIVFYGVGVLESLAAITLLVRAFRRGRREALSSLIGVSLCVPAIANDLLLALGIIVGTPSMLPHAFLMYAFGVAGTLLLRYRVAAGELEETATSLRNKSEELRHSYAELKLVQDELVRKKQLAAVGELAAAIAHEVRNPLAVIVNAVAGLRRVELKEGDRATLLNIVEEESGRLNRLVTDLLRFARPVDVKRSPVSLIELANRTRSVVGDDYEVDVRASDDPDIQVIWVDPNLFRLVLDNLVSNACQSMRGGGRVEISVSRKDHHGELAAMVEIRDRGHGMDAQVKRRALDPFFTTRPSGTGLGLPIVQRIVEAHGGELTIESAEGQGTTVTLAIPVRAPAQNGDRSESRQKVA